MHSLTLELLNVSAKMDAFELVRQGTKRAVVLSRAPAQLQDLQMAFLKSTSQNRLKNVDKSIVFYNLWNLPSLLLQNGSFFTV